MQSSTPAGRAGRPRSAAADTAILAATRAALVDLGWSKLALGDVATRAGVAKTTLYRRWAGKNELVVDAVAELFDELELPDRGSLAADIEGVVLQFAAILARPEARSGLMAVVAESTRDDALRERIRTSIVERQKRLVLEGRARAQARGELPPETDATEAARTADLIFDVVAGAVVHRTLVSARAADEEWVRGLTQVLLWGLAGAAGEPGARGDGGDGGGVGPGGGTDAEPAAPR
ncbi:transcriptional regulator [Streptomyces anthocyanicus]|uniref:TetR/AcrR family transcriptional regulator n=2 Tax=Streptomyces TaxID=1883 RepID=UPI00087A3205|nr:MULTISPECIES: TetR/AcrR family transcriptional regulator [Streptomyces]REH23641.1 transcriptional regulator /TetR family transcriptional regulator [Streptomyces sp. 2221.1]GGL47605.1 transcriptional regulator [Streptomyces anthocyanicus]SDT75132.1 transcriptional regulator /transcriptional regulator, TetR family [Streptomyces sp. 2114.2]